VCDVADAEGKTTPNNGMVVVVEPLTFVVKLFDVTNELAS
jgi:hypothetical protein